MTGKQPTQYHLDAMRDERDALQAQLNAMKPEKKMPWWVWLIVIVMVIIIIRIIIRSLKK